MVIVSFLIALFAIAAQPQQVGEDFAQGATEWSVPVVTEGFIGRAWVCDPASVGIGWQPEVGPSAEQVVVLRAAAVAETTEDDVCYAGLDTATGALVTGP